MPNDDTHTEKMPIVSGLGNVSPDGMQLHEPRAIRPSTKARGGRVPRVCGSDVKEGKRITHLSVYRNIRQDEKWKENYITWVKKGKRTQRNLKWTGVMNATREGEHTINPPYIRLLHVITHVTYAPELPRNRFPTIPRTVGNDIYEKV